MSYPLSLFLTLSFTIFLLKPRTRYILINGMFVLAILYSFLLGYLFAFDPYFLSHHGYDWFPYRLWYTEKGLFRLIGCFMITTGVFLSFIICKLSSSPSTANKPHP